MNESYDLLETSRGPEARQREWALEVSVFLILSGACRSVRRKNSQNNGYFCSKIEDRGAIGASRSEAIEDREAKRSKIAKRCDRRSRSDVIEASRSDAPGASQVITRRGVKGEAPPGASSSSDCRCPPRYYPANLTRQHLPSFVFVLI